MGWNEVINELEEKIEKTLNGTFRPMDGVGLFCVRYPPKQEREALKHFSRLAKKLEENGYRTAWISLKDVLKQALASMIGCRLDDLSKELLNLERERKREELWDTLSEYLPDEITKVVNGSLKEQHDSNVSKEGIAFLVRTSALFPFLRPSTLASRLDGERGWIIVFAYPEIDVQSSDPRGGCYRGEVIRWR